MNEVIVAKFGGSSLADSAQFKKVKDIIDADSRRRYIIPSAPGKRNGKDHKVTDLLYMCHQLASHGLGFNEVFIIIRKRYEDICQELNLNLNITEILDKIEKDIGEGESADYAASRGEYVNGLILADYLGFEFIDAAQVIVFDGKNKYDEKATEIKIKERLKESSNAVIPGFYGANENSEIVTFSRGGSDVTGAIISNAVEACLYENWTDVSGFLMADPKIVQHPKSIESITYKELRELSYMGAPVLHEEAIFPIRKKGIPINIKNTNVPKDKGTMIVNESVPVIAKGITGIAGKKDFTVISVEKTLMADEKNFFRKLISVFETNDISIEHMPSSIDSISVIVDSNELNSNLKKIIEGIRIYCNPDSIITYPNMALIAVVGRGMVRTTGTSAKLFTSLSQADINIRMITQGSSEMNIIIGVENEDFDKAITAIYNEFK